MVEIKYDEIKEKVDAGWKKDALAEHYGLNISQMGKVLKECNLRIRKFKKPSYKIIGLPNRKIGNPDFSHENNDITYDEVSNETFITKFT